MVALHYDDSTHYSIATVAATVLRGELLQLYALKTVAIVVACS